VVTTGVAGVVVVGGVGVVAGAGDWVACGDASAVMVICDIVICADRTFSDLNRFAMLNDGNEVLF
jgi:hypothetical protein